IPAKGLRLRIRGLRIGYVQSQMARAQATRVSTKRGCLMDRGLFLIFALTFIIHLIGTLAYSVRISATRTRRIAISLSLFNILVLVSRTSNSFQAPLLAKRVEQKLATGANGAAITDFGAALLAFGIRAVPELNPSAHVEKHHQCISGHAHPVDGDSSEYRGDGYLDSRGFLCPICRLPASGIAGDIQSTIGDHQWSGDHPDVHVHRSLFVDADG